MLPNLLKHQPPDLGKSYLNFKDLCESKYQLLFNGRKQVGIKWTKNQKAFIHYSQTIDDVYEKLEDYNSTKKRKVLIVLMTW